MDREFWQKKWEAPKQGFHLTKVNPNLLKFWSQVAADRSRVLVPLCGKSQDMSYLSSLGHDVIGVELIEKACLEFVQESSDQFERQGDWFIGDGLKLFCGDILKAPIPSHSIDIIYDRAAMVALEPDQRKEYAKTLKTFLAPKGKIFLITLEYDQHLVTGPPFSVEEGEIRDLYSDKEFNFMSLSRHRDKAQSDKFKQAQVESINEVVTILEKK